MVFLFLWIFSPRVVYFLSPDSLIWWLILSVLATVSSSNKVHIQLWWAKTINHQFLLYGKYKPSTVVTNQRLNKFDPICVTGIRNPNGVSIKIILLSNARRVQELTIQKGFKTATIFCTLKYTWSPYTDEQWHYVMWCDAMCVHVCSSRTKASVLRSLYCQGFSSLFTATMMVFEMSQLYFLCLYTIRVSSLSISQPDPCLSTVFASIHIN